MKIYCGEKFPLTRLRRNRNSEAMRDLLAQTTVCPSNLILPIFVIEGKNIKEKINNFTIIIGRFIPIPSHLK